MGLANGKGELNEVVKALDVRIELWEREVEVHRPCCVDDLSHGILHATDQGLFKTEIGLLESTVQCYDFARLLGADVKPPIKQAAESGFHW